jgi:hypothetical protein
MRRVTDKLEQSSQDPNCAMRPAGHATASGASTPASSGSPVTLHAQQIGGTPPRPRHAPGGMCGSSIEEEGPASAAAASATGAGAGATMGSPSGAGGVPMHLLNTPEKSWAPGRAGLAGGPPAGTPLPGSAWECLQEAGSFGGPEEGCRTPEEDFGRELSFQVLGKDLSSSAAKLPSPRLTGCSSSERNLGTGGGIPRVGSGLRDPTRSHSGETTAGAGGAAAGDFQWNSMVQSSSQSFTSGMRPSIAPPDAPQAWQRAAPPTKPAGRSRFAA